jgi:hypothetical protein
MITIYGYFDDYGTVPTFDPGLDVNCPVCHKKLSDPMKTINLMLPGDKRSYFYRVHKPCWDNLTPEQQGDVDGLLLDPIIQTKNTN